MVNDMTVGSMNAEKMAVYKAKLTESYSRLPAGARPLFINRIKGDPQLRDFAEELSAPKKEEKESGGNPLLNAFNAPFNWIGEHITEPFGAIVTSPFTSEKKTPRLEGESWLASEKRQYDEQVPTLLKFGIETIPWLVPSLISGGAGAIGRVASIGSKLSQTAGVVQKIGQAGSLIGKVQKVAKGGEVVKLVGGATRIAKAGEMIEEGTGLAGVLGNLGKAGSLTRSAGNFAGLTAQYSPWGLTEQAVGAVVGRVIKGVTAPLRKSTSSVIYESLEKSGSTMLPSEELQNTVYRDDNYRAFTRWAEGKPLLGKAVKAIFGEKGFVDATSREPIDVVKRAFVNMVGLEEIGNNMVRNTMPRLRVHGSPTKILNLTEDGIIGGARPQGVGTVTKEYDDILGLANRAPEPTTKGYVHYSHTEGIKELSPDYHGTGALGSSRAKRDYPEIYQGEIYGYNPVHVKEVNVPSKSVYVGDIPADKILRPDSADWARLREKSIAASKKSGYAEFDKVAPFEIMKELAKKEGWEAMDRGSDGVVSLVKRNVTEVPDVFVKEVTKLAEDPNIGGATYKLVGGKFVNMAKTKNYSVGVFKNIEDNPGTLRSMVGKSKGVNKGELLQFISQNYDLLKTGKYGLGLWNDNGRIVYDVVALTPVETVAKMIANDKIQAEYFDLAKMKSIVTTPLTAAETGSSKRVYDVMEHLDDYKFETPAQEKYFETVKQIKKEVDDLLVSEGLKPPKGYHRVVKGIQKADGSVVDSTYGSDASLRRVYETQEEAVTAHLKRGEVILYGNQPNEIVQEYINTAVKRIARKRYTDTVGKLGKTASELFSNYYPAEAEQIAAISNRIGAAKDALKAVQNVITTKGKTIAGATMAKIKRELPDVGAKLEDLYVVRPEAADKIIKAMAGEVSRTTSLIHGEYGKRLTNLMKQLNLNTSSSTDDIIKALTVNPAEINKYARILSEINTTWRGKTNLTAEDVADAIRSFNMDSEAVTTGLTSHMANMKEVAIGDLEKMLKDMGMDEQAINRMTGKAYAEHYAMSKKSFDNFLTDNKSSITRVIEEGKTEVAPLVKKRYEFKQQFAGKESWSREQGRDLWQTYRRLPEFKTGGEFKLFPAEVTQYMEKNYAVKGNEWVKAMGKVGGVSRSLTAVMDDSAPFVQGLFVLGRNPVAWAKATVKQLQFMVHPEQLDAYMVANQALHNDMVKYGIPTAVTEMFEALPSIERFASKIPVVGKVANKAIEQTYGRAEAAYKGFLQVSRDNLWKSLKKTSMTPAELQELGRSVSLMTGDLSTAAMGVSATQRDIENAFIFFSPRFTRASLALVGDIFKGGLSGAEARKAVAGLAAGGAAMYLGVCALLKQEPEFDPTSGKFMTIEAGDTRVGVGGILYSLTRLAGNLATVDSPTDLLKMDRYDNPFIKFMYGKSAPLTGMIVGAMERTDYMGEPFETPADWAQFVASKFMPFTAQPLMDKQGTEPQEMVSQFMGARSFPESVYDQRDELRDEVAMEQYGVSYKALPRSKRMGIDGAPEIIEMTESLKDKGRETPENIAWGNWNVNGEQIEDTYRKAIEDASAEYRQIGDGVTFREKVDTAKNNRRASYALRAKLPEFETIQAYFSAPKSAEVLATMNPLDIASDEYYKQMYSEDMYDEYGNYNFYEADNRETAFVQKYGQEALDEIDNVSIAKWAGTDIYQQLLQSRKALEPYWQLSSHVWDDSPQIKNLWDNSPEMMQAYNKWQTLLYSDALEAKKFLLSQPQAMILVQYAKKLAIMKRQLKYSNPEVAQALKTFY